MARKPNKRDRTGFYRDVTDIGIRLAGAKRAATGPHDSMVAYWQGKLNGYLSAVETMYGHDESYNLRVNVALIYGRQPE